MSQDLSEMDFQRFWRRLQQLGLNAYEARSYLVLIGHTRFKALELAARAHVPRQKIYEVLDSLVEKGFTGGPGEDETVFSRRADARNSELPCQTRSNAAAGV